MSKTKYPLITITKQRELMEVVSKATDMIAATNRSVEKGVKLLIKAYTPKLTATKPKWFGLSRTKSYLEQNGYRDVTEQIIDRYRSLLYTIDTINGHKVHFGPADIREIGAKYKDRYRQLEEHAFAGQLTMPLADYDRLMSAPAMDSGIFYDWNTWPDNFFEEN